VYRLPLNSPGSKASPEIASHKPTQEQSGAWNPDTFRVADNSPI
jgi:hypothetical protein